MNSTIKCPHCGKDVKISDALNHELKEETERIIKATEEETRKKIQEEFAQKDKERKAELEDEKKKNKELLVAFEKKISDMQKALEEAQRKGKQGSQQLQGEVLELDLEEKLKSHFPMDEFL